MTLKIRCTRCGVEREVPDGWKFKSCSKCIARKRTKRAEEKKTKQQAKAREVSLQIKRGNLNYGLKHVREKFMEWSDFHEQYPNRTYADYLDCKENEQQKWSDVGQVDLDQQFEASEYPLYDDVCIEFRRQVLLNESSVDKLFFWDSHRVQCPPCNAWFLRHKPAHRGFKGGDIWKKPEERRSQPSDSKLTDELHECLEEDYGRDY